MKAKTLWCCIFILLSIVGCKKTTNNVIKVNPNLPEPPEVNANPNYPQFSWNKVPLYIHIRKNTAFTASELSYLAQFPLITLEKSTGYTTFGSTEDGILNAASAIKAINSNAKILYYKNCVINWENYKEDEAFMKANPSAALTNTQGRVVTMSNGTTPFFDITQENVRNYWLAHVKKITDSPNIDGLFVDANIKVLVPSFFNALVGVTKQQAIRNSYFQMMADMKTQLSKNNLIIANIIRVRPEFTDSGREFLDYFDGSYLEIFEPSLTSKTYETYLAAGIDAVQKTAKEGKVIAMTLGVSDGSSGDGLDPIFGNLTLTGEALTKRVDYLLALFLICAEKYSYLNLHDGYNSVTSGLFNKPFFPQLERRLGKPKGSAVKNGFIYTRQFEFVDVTLDIKNKTSILAWK